MTTQHTPELKPKADKILSDILFYSGPLGHASWCEKIGRGEEVNPLIGWETLAGYINLLASEAQVLVQTRDPLFDELVEALRDIMRRERPYHCEKAIAVLAKVGEL